MAKADDGSANGGDDVVVPLRSDAVHPRDRTNAERQARWRQSQRNGGRKKTSKKHRKDSTVTPAVTPSTAPADARPTVTETLVCGYPASSIQPPVPPPPFVPPKKELAQRDVHYGRGIRFAAMIAALGLAMVSGGFSIVGLASIFVGAFWPVAGMGLALELGKLAAVAWLGHQPDRGLYGWP